MAILLLYQICSSLMSVAKNICLWNCPSTNSMCCIHESFQTSFTCRTYIHISEWAKIFGCHLHMCEYAYHLWLKGDDFDNVQGN